MKSITKVLNEAWDGGFSVSGDFARSNAATVAYLACTGSITTNITSNVYGKRWLITPKGIEELFAEKGMDF